MKYPNNLNKRQTSKNKEKEKSQPQTINTEKNRLLRDEINVLLAHKKTSKNLGTKL